MPQQGDKRLERRQVATTTTLGPWLTTSSTPTAVESGAVAIRKPDPLPRVHASQQQQQQQQQLTRPPGVSAVVSAAPAPTHDARLRELEAVLFPSQSQRPGPELPIVGEIASGAQPSNTVLDADVALPRLGFIDWLAKDLGQTGRHVTRV